MDIVLATRNQHKLREFRQMLEHDDVRIVALDSFPDCPEVVEDGETFAENALKKARSVAAHTGRVSISDDSGLEVGFLGGAPGIYSARYAGASATDDDNNRLLLSKLAGVPAPERGAQFTCVIAVAAPGGPEQTVQGACPGRILGELRGGQGFGYDPLFLYEDFNLTFSEMSAEQKNSISHRRRAIEELKKILSNFL